MQDNISAEELLDRYSDMVYRIAFARAGNVHDAQDITQEVFLRYIKAGLSYSDEEHRKAWLIRVAINTGNSFLKSAWFRHRAEFTEAADKTEAMPEQSELSCAVAELPEKYRVAIHLFYFEELSMKEMCGVLGISEGAVKSRLHRAREMLKTKLKEAEYEF